MRSGEPSATAWSVAHYRAQHQDLDQASIFYDPLARAIVGAERSRFDPLLGTDDVDAPEGLREQMRFFVAARQRFAEDIIEAAAGRGVRQVVILGAGLDTFGLRNPVPDLRVFEVDHPDSARWKQERLEQAGLRPPETLAFVGVDFERDRLLDELLAHGFDLSQPAAFTWLGVMPYLTADAIGDTLSQVAEVSGAEIVFDYAADLSSPWAHELLARVEEVGEPMRSTHRQRDVVDLVTRHGFEIVTDLNLSDVVGLYATAGQLKTSMAEFEHTVRIAHARTRA